MTDPKEALAHYRALELNKPEPDYVNHPPHYTSSPARCYKCGHHIECIDVIQHMNLPVGAAVKYLWRVDEKGDPVENLKKAIWFINKEIERREKSGQEG